MSENNVINVETINSAISSIETLLPKITSNLDSVNRISTDLKSAWDSDNSAIVASKVTDIYNKLSELNGSINNLKTKVQQVVTNTVTSDTVSFNGNSSMRIFGEK